MKKTRILLGGLALGTVMVLMPSAGRASIIGSSHDFYVNPNLWAGGSPYIASTNGSVNSVCSECHQIHHAPDPTKGPLWIHAASANATTGYKTYEQAGSESYDALHLDTPTLGDASIACLSCHDGTVGINQTTVLNMDGSLTPVNKTKGTLLKLGGIVDADKHIIPVGASGNDLTHTHPIGIDYSKAVTAANTLYGVTELWPATAGAYPYNRLGGANHTQLECSTCHDIHGTVTIPGGSGKCIACHNK